MTSRRFLPFAAATLALAFAAQAQQAPQLPKIDGEAAVASVNGEAVTLEEYLREFSALHSEATDRGQVVPKRDPTELLDRLVRAKLILQEASNIGLDELPEFEAAMRGATKEALRAAVLDRPARDVPAPAASRIDTAYRGRETELQVASVSFKTSEEAKLHVAELAKAANFVETARWLVAEGTAVGLEEPAFLKRKDVLPEIAKVLDGLHDGEVSPPFPAAGKVFVVKLIGRRLPNDPAAREAVKQELWSSDRGAAVLSYVTKIRERKVKVDDALMESLDFDADPASFPKFLEDDRVVARVQGADAIKVKDLAGAVKKKLFHGVEQAGEKKRLNKVKRATLEELTTESAIQQEGKALGLDQTPEFKAEIRSVREDTLFGLFVQKVIEPSIRIDDADVKKAYDAGIGEFTSPEMIRMESMAFENVESAQHAVDKLKAGANLTWMRSNAEGRVDPQDVPDPLRFDGRLLTAVSLPPEVLKSLEGAVPGDYRLFVEPGGRGHVLALRDRVPARPAPFEEVRMEVARRVFNQKRQASMDDWVAKLRGASEVKVFADSSQLRDLVARKVRG